MFQCNFIRKTCISIILAASKIISAMTKCAIAPALGVAVSIYSQYPFNALSGTSPTNTSW
ncbi:hypothetical protein THRCLA_21332 [Thraustotheca clavata]|uniref:Uncharacterized protein n=1 Tax=Thraustotheca clavata TaxID=74557 RepID=A0A1V9ZXL6_9STRA|nr:hypothetical protein THRCLA_21332 [Thraustotheca clavata]